MNEVQELFCNNWMFLSDLDVDIVDKVGDEVKDTGRRTALDIRSIATAAAILTLAEIIASK